MNLSQLTAALTACSLLTSVVPVAAAVPSRTYVAPGTRGIAADIGRTRDVRDLGRLAATQTVRVGLLMHFQHEDELRRLTRLQSEHGSPYYRKFVNNAQWDAYFAPARATYERTASVMQRAGFRMYRTYQNRGFIVMEAPTSAVERYFHTEIHRVFQLGRGIRYANVRPATMPAELRSAVVSVAGLHTTQSVFAGHLTLPRNATPRNVRAALKPAPRRLATSASPKPVTVQSPAPNPMPDPTESADPPTTDYVNSLGGYGPPIFANAYDFPVQHGYGGTGRAAGSVIDSDFSDVDMAKEFMAYNIPNTGSSTRVCTDPGNVCTICTTTSATTTTATCDVLGESTLDAEAIRTLAPDAKFYEYLINHTTSLIDLNIEAAYERVVNDNVVDAVNSSFGGCETDDPSGLYAYNYIAMEGAAKGITFSASAGDTGAFSCGTYASNGVPQTFVNVSSPCSAYYFTCVGGTTFEQIPDATAALTHDYTGERAWLQGGGGFSVLEPLPDWQMAAVAAGNPASTSTLGRNVPDLAMTADAGPFFIGGTEGVGLAIVFNGNMQGSGGTSLSSPMYVALQTSANQTKGLRAGWINPRLYQIQANAAGYAAAFRDIAVGMNLRYAAAPGYDEATGIGTPLGFGLAGVE